MLRAPSPFEVLGRVDGNASKVNSLGDYSFSTTFNVVDLSPYLEDDHLANLSVNSLQKAEDDGGLSMEHDLGPRINQGNPSSSTKV